MDALSSLPKQTYQVKSEDMKNQELLNPSRFNTLRDTTPVPTTWEAIVTEIVSNRHEAATRHYREVCALLAEAEAAGTDTAHIEELKQQKQRLKAAQSAFVPSVVLQGGRAAKDIIAYTRCLMVDIDDIAPERFAEILAKVRADRYGFIVHTTFSGLGIRVIARADVEVTKQNFGQVWQLVNDYYARLTGTAIDRQCKNATRMSVICHDPDVLFRPDAPPMPVSVWAAAPQANAKPKNGRKVGRPVTAERAADTVKRLVEADGIVYAPGSHNDYIARCLYWMNRFGVAEADAQTWALSEFADYDATEHSVASTVHSCYAKVAEHGTRRISDFGGSRGRGKGGGVGRPSTKASVEEMEAFVREWGEFRMNRLINQLEFRRSAPGTSYELQDTSTEKDLVARNSSLVADWQRMTDREENSIWRAMHHEGMDVDVQRIRTLLQSDFVKEHDPLREYLDALPAWDGVTDYIGQLSAMVHCRCTSPAEFDFYFRRWLVGIIGGALSKDSTNHVIFVLLGRQGVYKSSFMKNLLPPELRRYYTVKLNSQRMDKDDALAVTENLLINFEELDSMNRKELNQLKALCSDPFINERPAYGRNKVYLPHVASFCGTGNNVQFLTDDSGNRRWLPFEVESIDNPWEVTLPYEGIYAQAYALFRQGFRYWFEQAEVDALNKRNRRFEAPNPEREMLLMHYRKPTERETAKKVTASDVVARFGGAIRLNERKMSNALKELGYDVIHTRNGNIWLVMERTADEINQILPEEMVGRTENREV